MGKKISKACIDLVKKWEGCHLTAYTDEVGVWTIGYGITNADYSVTGLKVSKGVKITQAQADGMLEESLNKKYLPLVMMYDNKYGWNQNELDALVSFAYNIGSITALTDKGTRSRATIASKILEYNKAGGVVYRGLTNRRKEERELFVKPCKTGYTGTFPVIKTTVENNSDCIADVIAWAKKYAGDNRYKYKTWTANKKTHQCPICHPGSGKGWNCIGFVSAAFYHGGKVHGHKCSCSGILTNAFAQFDNITLGKWQERNGKDWKLVAKQTTKIPQSKLKKGDVVICYNGKTYTHVALYIGNGKIIDATGAHGITTRKYSALKTPKVAFRYTGQIKPVKKNKALSANDKRSLQVKRLQAFLIWEGSLKSTIKTGTMDTATVNAVKKFQKKTGIKASGKFGAKTLAAAQAYRK